MILVKMKTVFNTGKIECAYKVSTDYEMNPMHIHDVYEIYMVQSSGVKILVNNQLYDLECGNVMLFSNKDLHKVSIPKKTPYQRYVITFSPEILNQNERAELLRCFDNTDMQHNHKLQLTPEEQNTLIAYIRELQDEQRQQQLSQLGQQLALCRILVFLNRVCLQRQQQLPVPARCQDTRIQTVLEYIDANYSRQISLEELSKLCFLNKYYLCRLFRDRTDFCINDYIVYRRLSEAVILLRKGKRVSDIARLCGFTSDTFFITTFKKQFGMTPYQYMRVVLDGNKHE